MKTQDSDMAGKQATIPSPGPPRRRRWLPGIGAIIVVAFLIGASALVFAQLRQHQANQTIPTPPVAQWKQVLKGYTFTSLVAGRSNPAVLYACAVPYAASQSSTGTISVLRSTDFGDHWQDIGSRAALNEICQLAVNPADGNEIYAISLANNAQRNEVLKHSTDGGQTWETIQPVLHVPATQAPALWTVQQIRLEGNHLFGVQWILPRALPENLPVRAFSFLLPRLVTSVDGGHNWTVIDNQFAAQQLGVHSYAVDPTNPNTIYDLVGHLMLPIKEVPPYDPLPYTGLNQQLFKTTDGGATWQMLLNGMPYGSQVQLATANPQLIYVGGTISPFPLTARSPESPYPITPGAFQLQVSNNGGTTWKNVAIPSDMQSSQSWFVSPGGQVYASAAILFSGTPITNSQAIRRYDPTTNRWSDVTRPPAPGTLQQLTPAQANSGAILWFTGTTSTGQMTLDRFVT